MNTNPNAPSTPILPLLLTSLQTSHFPLPSPTFLHPILHPSTHRPLSLPVLVATAKHRLLNTSLTTPHLLSPSTRPLPPNLSNPLAKEILLPADTPVQVLDIDDISRSKSDVLSELERERQRERIKGREVIRLGAEDASAPREDGPPSTPAADARPEHPRAGDSLAASPGPFKLLLQDCSGETIYGYETGRVKKIGFPPKMHIGSLRNMISCHHNFHSISLSNHFH
ncbi:hypothetical protein EYC84_009134 [Monilinia fructicola]|uniref:RecQ mediated genome instability protein 1 OB-fold domain-containing protein n=1 Tax=Monilinia fructicola TaxID=38448 RepID=A0A5M9JAG2_MONFR|nr:hypothetical protein EYC84_009134 [Monilinia fructicola]